MLSDKIVSRKASNENRDHQGVDNVRVDDPVTQCNGHYLKVRQKLRHQTCKGDNGPNARGYGFQVGWRHFGEQGSGRSLERLKANKRDRKSNGILANPKEPIIVVMTILLDFAE